MLWEIESSEPNLLLAPDDLDLNSAFADQHQIRVFDLSQLDVDRVEIKVKMRPMSLRSHHSISDRFRGFSPPDTRSDSHLHPEKYRSDLDSR